MNTHIYVHRYILIHTQTYSCTHTSTTTPTPTPTPTHTHTHNHTHTRTHTHTHTHTYTYTLTYTYTYTYTRTYICTYIRTQPYPGLMRGLLPCIVRDSLYTCGLLGVTPYTQSYLMEKGYSQSSAGVYASVLGGCSAAFFSHPADMVKICMQADLQQERFTTFSRTIDKLVREKGFKSLFRGLLWRSINIIGTVFIANEIRVRVIPLIVEHKHRSSGGQKIVT